VSVEASIEASELASAMLGPAQRDAIERWFVEVVRRALTGGDRDRSR
jgi:hypothetical protein